MRFDASTFNLIRSTLYALLLVVPVISGAQVEEPSQAGQAGQQQEAEEEGNRRVKRLGDVSSNEWEMDLSVPEGTPSDEHPQSEFDLPDPEQNAQLQNLLSTLVTRPGNSATLAALDEFLDGVLTQANQLVREGRLDESQHLLGVIRNVNPRKPGLAEAIEFLENLRNTGEWLQAASMAMDNDRILEPSEDNALFHLGRVLTVDPDNQEAHEGLMRAQTILIDRALESAEELDFDMAEEWLYEASLVKEDQSLVEDAREQVIGFQHEEIETIQEQIRQAIDSQDFDLGEFLLIDLVALIGNDERVRILRESLQEARVFGRYTQGQVIRDPFIELDGAAPAVVVIKPGSFLMGSPESEAGRKAAEGPQYRVTLTRGFALGMHEVTVEQFARFVGEARFRTEADTLGSSSIYDERSGRITERERINWSHDYEGEIAEPNQPVLHVDWYDAQAYVEWLSKVTGQRYRLPSEAEFELAIRAGSVSRFWWGDEDPDEAVENLTGERDESTSGRMWSSSFRKYGDGYWGPAPVGMFPANSLGLHDMAGNVSEWVEDCWHPTYSQAPKDGSAWVNRGCQRRVVRGGYWASSPEQARSAARISAKPNLHGPRVGFRIARDL